MPRSIAAHTLVTAEQSQKKIAAGLRLTRQQDQASESGAMKKALIIVAALLCAGYLFSGVPRHEDPLQYLNRTGQATVAVLASGPAGWWSAIKGGMTGLGQAVKQKTGV